LLFRSGCTDCFVLNFRAMPRGFGIRLAVTAFLFVMSYAVVFGSGTGVVEGRVQIAQSGGAHLADDTSAQKQKPPLTDYPVVVLSKDGKTEISQVAVDSEGRFHFNLAAGDYLLDVKRNGRSRLRVSARPFTVVAGQTVHVDLTVESAIEAM
jgi:Carboxypeptidase regulatory-like domain